MKVLAIDTSTSCGVVGLCIDGIAVAEVSLTSKESYSARLLPSIDWLLKSSDLKLEDIDGFGVTLGPGSFTGLRVGLSTIKGFAWSTKKPVAGLMSLEVLARQYVRENCFIIPLFDARRDQVFGSIYQWNGKNGSLETIVEPVAQSAADFAREKSSPLVFLGEGAERYRDQIVQSGNKAVRFAPSLFNFPHGSTIAGMAYQALESGHTIDIATAEPFYIRTSVAEENMRKGAA